MLHAAEPAPTPATLWTSDTPSALLGARGLVPRASLMESVHLVLGRRPSRRRGFPRSGVLPEDPLPAACPTWGSFRAATFASSDVQAEFTRGPTCPSFWVSRMSVELRSNTEFQTNQVFVCFSYQPSSLFNLHIIHNNWDCEDVGYISLGL